MICSADAELKDEVRVMWRWGGGGVSMELQRRFMDIVKEDGLGGEMDADDPLWWFLKGETKGSSA